MRRLIPIFLVSLLIFSFSYFTIELKQLRIENEELKRKIARLEGGKAPKPIGKTLKEELKKKRDFDTQWTLYDSNLTRFYSVTCQTFQESDRAGLGHLRTVRLQQRRGSLSQHLADRSFW